VFLKIAPKRWRLEINFSQDAVLMLSSMNLPDGIQVRFSALPCNSLKLNRATGYKKFVSYIILEDR
jgi:hypothetical protein